MTSEACGFMISPFVQQLTQESSRICR